MAVKFFNDQSDPQAAVDPTQTAVMKQFFKSFGQQLRVGMPGYIVTYDYKVQQASIQPAFKNEYSDGTVQNLPILYNVPILWPSGPNWYIHGPLPANSPVTIYFSDKALDSWKQNGAIQAPSDSRTHHITDAWAVPGLRPFGNPVPASNADDLLITVNNLQFRLKPNGHIQLFTGLNTADGVEFFSLLNQFMIAVITNNIPGAAAIQSRLESFVES